MGHEDQVIGLGDGAKSDFALNKTYRSGAQTYVRPIVKPVIGTVRVAVAGDPKVESLEFSVNGATGLINYTARSLQLVCPN